MDEYWRRALERVRVIPGVRSAALGMTAPFEMNIMLPVDAPGFPSPDGRPRGAQTDFAGVGYFATLGIPIGTATRVSDSRDLTRQDFSGDTFHRSYTANLTWQISQRNKANFFYHLGRMVRERLTGSTDERDRPLLDLTWDYPVHDEGVLGTEGAQAWGEPSAEAVLKEINGYEVATGRPLSGFVEMKADGSTAGGCWKPGPENPVA